MPDDEVYLAEILDRIRQRKWWVLLITIFVIIPVLIYLLLAKPVYKAEIFFMPPTVADLMELNQVAFLRERGLYYLDKVENKILPDTAFEIFLKQLQSKALLKKFVKQDSAELNLKYSKENKKDFVRATLIVEDPSVVTTLNDYVESVERHTAELLADRRRAKLEIMIRDIKLMIAAKAELKAENPLAQADLIELKERLNYLEKVKVSADNIITVTVDEAASIQEEPILFQKATILAFTTLSGCMLGLFVALVVPMRKVES